MMDVFTIEVQIWVQTPNTAPLPKRQMNNILAYFWQKGKIKSRDNL